VSITRNTETRWSVAIDAVTDFAVSVHLAAKHQENWVPASNETLERCPYLIIIAVVAGFVGRVRPTAADGLPHQRD
jgi:simple sugar transport system permease protein